MSSSVDDMTAVIPRPASVPEPGITLVSCPWCSGCGMVTPDKAAEWNAAYAELTKPIEPEPFGSP